jgi:hypothetical protein
MSHAPRGAATHRGSEASAAIVLSHVHWDARGSSLKGGMLAWPQALGRGISPVTTGRFAARAPARRWRRALPAQPLEVRFGSTSPGESGRVPGSRIAVASAALHGTPVPNRSLLSGFSGGTSTSVTVLGGSGRDSRG